MSTIIISRECIGKTHVRIIWILQSVKSVPNRIVSISQPYIRPIVRGKAKAPVEFGAKPDTTTRSSIALSILAMNVDYLARCPFLLFLILKFSRYIFKKNCPENLKNSNCFQAAACWADTKYLPGCELLPEENSCGFENFRGRKPLPLSVVSLMMIRCRKKPYDFCDITCKTHRTFVTISANRIGLWRRYV